MFSSQADELSHAQWKEEKTQLVQKQQNQLERLRSEHESKLKEQQVQMERDLTTRMQSELQRARSGWDKEHQLSRYDNQRLTERVAVDRWTP